MKFAHKIVLASTAILLAALLLLSMNQYFSMKEKMEDLLGSSVKEILQGISNAVDAEIQGKTNLARMTTSLVEDNFALSDAADIISKPVLRESFILIGFGHEETGRYVASDSSWDPGATWDPRKRPWYTDAKSANSLIITAPYADAVTKEIVVSVGTPVNQSGVFSGAIFFDVSLSGLAEMINKVNLFDAGYAFMVTKEGNIISHPDERLNGKTMREFLPGISIKNAIQTIDIKGEKSLVSFKEVKGLDWYVGVILDHDKAFDAISELRSDSILYSIVFLLIGVIALLFLIGLLLRPLSAINKAMGNVASGNADLTVRLSTDSDAEFASLAHNFNQFTGMLQELIKQIQNRGHEILKEVNETASGATNASNAIHLQLDELNALATCTNEMAATSTEVANTAKQAADAVHEADSAALASGHVIEGMTRSIASLSRQIDSSVEVVSHLETASSGIENILGVINGIAEQTNLLALNAAIEAARAGESGRGFAVVADEVRTLAQRTQEATTEIKGKIEQLQSGTSSAVTEMNQSKEIADQTVSQASKTNEALENIRNAIKTILDLNVQISHSVEEQVVVVEEVNKNTLNIKDISYQVSQEAEKVHSTMQNQVNNIRKQEEMLDQFKV